MTARTDAARTELEDTIRRLAPALIDAPDGILLADWTLVLSTLPDDDHDHGADVDVVTRPGALISHVLGALRVATLATETDLLDGWRDQ